MTITQPKCRAKDPSRCRKHGTPVSTGSTEADLKGRINDVLSNKKSRFHTDYSVGYEPVPAVSFIGTSDNGYSGFWVHGQPARDLKQVWDYARGDAHAQSKIQWYDSEAKEFSNVENVGDFSRQKQAENITNILKAQAPFLKFSKKEIKELETQLSDVHLKRIPLGNGRFGLHRLENRTGGHWLFGAVQDKHFTDEHRQALTRVNLNLAHIYKAYESEK